jgi:hypothetical protein
MSPRAKARMAGIFQLLEALTSTFGQIIILGKLVVPGNGAITAANILSHKDLFWLGFTSSVIGAIFHVAWAFLMYELFKHVNRALSRFATFIILVGCAIQTLTALFYIAPLLILGGGNPAGAFTVSQLQELSTIFLKLNSQCFEINLVFFGLWVVLTGYLIFRSKLLPKLLGILFMIAGLGWLFFLYPPFAHQIFPLIAVASAIGEVPLELWLMVKSINSERWKEQVDAALP